MSSQKSPLFLSVLLLCLLMSGLGSHTVQAQPAQTQPAQAVKGNFSGTLAGQLPLKLHIVAAPDGSLSGTIDSPNQGAIGLACGDFLLEGETLSFKVPSVSGSWTGKIADGGATLQGTWTQGAPLPLTFTRDIIPAAKPSPVDGIWLGTLVAGPQSLRIQLTVKSDAAGHELCTLDSLDQGAFGLPCSNIVYSEQSFSFEIPVVNGRWAGKLSAEGRSLSGSWTQGMTFPLDFARQEKAIAPPPVPPATYSPAIAPVHAAEMQVALDRDFEKALKSGALAPETAVGVTIGVLRDGVHRVFSYGTARPDSIFEIGSVSKTFTGLILAQMIEQGKVQLDLPVRELLPAGTVAKPPGREISLLDLVTQHSGLPRLPDNLDVSDTVNPYAQYRAADLYHFVAQHGVAVPKNAPFLYSNLGVGLLGQALANRAGLSYAQLLEQEVTSPLELKDTVVSLTTEQQSRFIQGYTPEHRQAHAWDIDALAGAGAIRSTAGDLLTYLQAQLHPQQVPTGKSPSARTLTKAIDLSHELRQTAGPGMHIAFTWLHEDASGTYWHNGATGGYSSFVFFNPQGDYAAVVLVNVTAGPHGSLADLIGQHIGQRFAGKPAIDL